jgi:general secretion pathway protein I
MRFASIGSPGVLMSFRISRCDNGQTPAGRERRRAAGNAGFTLIEVLVAIAVLAVALAATGALVGSTVKAVRAVDRRLPLLETAQDLLAALPDRNALKPGSQSGATGDFRWRIDVIPLAMPLPSAAAPSLTTTNPALTGPAAAAPRTLNWMPVAITVRVQGTEGPPLRLDTVRLVPRTAG